MSPLDVVDTYGITVLDGLAYGLLLFCVAAGLTLIFGVMGVLNLAHGTLYLLGTYLAWAIFDGGWAGLALAVAAGAVAGAVGGAGLSVAMRPLAGRHLDQALATLGIAFVAADLFTAVFGAEPLPADPPTALAGSVTMAGHSYPAWRLVFIGLAAVLASALLLVLERSRAGAVVRAVAADETMADATGIATRTVQTAVLAAGGALAVAVGVLGAPVLGPAPGVDTTVLVQSLIVVVVGGFGSVRGAFVAALGVGQIETLGVALAPNLAPFLLFGVMLAVLSIRGGASAGVRMT